MKARTPLFKSRCTVCMHQSVQDVLAFEDPWRRVFTWSSYSQRSAQVAAQGRRVVGYAWFMVQPCPLPLWRACEDAGGEIVFVPRVALNQPYCTKEQINNHLYFSKIKFSSSHHSSRWVTSPTEDSFGAPVCVLPLWDDMPPTPILGFR